MRTLRPKERLELNEEDETEILESEQLPYMTTIAMDTSETTVEVVATSEVSHMLPSKAQDDVTANLKVDTNYPLINDMQQVQEKEGLLDFKENAKVLIKPSISQMEPLQVTQVEVNSSLDDYHSSKIKTETNALQSFVAAESVVTSEILANHSLSDLKKDDQNTQNAKSTMILKDAIGVSESITSLNETPLEETSLKKSSASVSFSPFAELSVTEVVGEIKEQDVDIISAHKSATSKLNFNLLESIQVGEVFVEDKSGKYYPELIVPTEMARKDVLVSNQLVTELHDVQEKEGPFSALKLPPFQEANVDITSKDSLVISIGETNEKEGELPLPEIPTSVTVDKDLTLHLGLDNSIVNSHLKESEFTPEAFASKKATIGVNEHHHKFNLETSIHDSERSLDETKSTSKVRAAISISALDKNFVEEVNVNESEQELIIKEDKHAATADLDVRAMEPIVTSETLHMTSLSELTIAENIPNESATQSVITSNAKIVTYPLVHDQETREEFSSRRPENVTQSMIPNIPLSILETESSESENRLLLNKVPDGTNAQLTLTHQLKTPVFQEVTTADQIDFMRTSIKVVDVASEHRDLNTEITVLQTTVDEQLNKLDKGQTKQSKAVTTFIGNESINVTEIVTNTTEEKLEIDKLKSNTFAKVEIDTDHKIALTSVVNPRDALNIFDTLAPNYEEAHIASNVLSSIQISENNVLDSQTQLQTDVQPDFKSIAPIIIPSNETVEITEIIQHEKECDYSIGQSPVTYTASTEISGRPVAMLSELIIDSSVGYTEEGNLIDKFKKANVENIVHKEVIISTTDYNEKESLLDKMAKPCTASASVNIDSNQAIIVEDNKPEDIPSEFEKPSEILWASATKATMAKEALTQQEIFVNVSEGLLTSEQKDLETKPSISLATLQAPEHNEKIAIESENLLVVPNAPDKQTADFTITHQHGVETSETVSQTDNLENTKDLKMDYKIASSKIDNFYGKTANVEEIITNQQTVDLTDDKFSLQKSEVKPVASFTLEQTEIVTAESETVLPEQKTVKSTVSTDFTETQAVITTCIETIDKEKEFTGKIALPTQDISVEFVPQISTIDTEVMVTSDVTKLQETASKLFVASETRDDLQKHLEAIQVLVGEKESDLILTKKDSEFQALQILTEFSAKEITEVQFVEKENDIKDRTEIVGMTAHTSINEQQSLQNTEIITTQESEDFKTSTATLIHASTTQDLQEAVQELAPFIGEVEDDFIKEAPTKRTLKGNVEEQKSVRVTEIIPTESEVPLHKTQAIKTETLKLKLEENNYVNISEVMPSEKEEEIKLTQEHVNQEKPGIIIESHQHITITDTQTREKEDYIQSKDTPHSNIKHIDINATQHITTSEILVIESSSEFEGKRSIKDEKAHQSQQITEPLNNEEQQVIENVSVLSSLYKPEQYQAIQEITGLKLVEQTEVIPEEQPSIFSKYLPKDETVQPTQTTVKEIISTQPHVIETTKNLMSEFQPEKNTVQFELELHKSYITTEDSAQELTGNIVIPENYQKTAQKQMIELKSLQQTEVIIGEKSEMFNQTLENRDEKADEIPITLQELYHSKPEVLECTHEFSGNFKPETSKVSFDIKTHKSCIVTQDFTHEVPSELTAEVSGKKRQVTKQILEMKSVEQTEIITGENTSAVEAFTHEEKTVVAKPIENQPLSQSDIVVHEKETEASFGIPKTLENALVSISTTEGITVFQITHEDTQDTLIPSEGRKVTAEKCFTPLTHIQCTENVLESRADDLPTHKTQSKTTSISTSEITPLIITDNTCLQHETELHITEPNKQKLTKGMMVANELAITEEFVGEQTTPYTSRQPKSVISEAIKIAEDVYHLVTLSDHQTVITGKFKS